MSTHQPGTRILATVMFTDMVGYTALMQKDEKLAKVKRDRHRQVLQTYHEQFQGRIIQYFGDGTVSIFTSALNAVSCAIEIQRALKEPIEVPLRIGMLTGEILLEEDGIFGDAVNLASRIESFAIPDSILISDITYEAVKNQASFSFVDMGLFSLKNVERPFRIFANANEGILVPKAEELSGKGKVFSTNTTNLPKPLTKFFGRTNELEELTELVKNHRLITLTGPGGTGKTRTSIKVAEALSSFFSDGVQWIPLASVREVEVVPFEMAKALKLKEDPVLSMEEVLAKFIGEKSLLMVLDNFEQIVGAVSLIEGLLARCTNLHIIVSSRICLNAEGEYEYKLPPLLLPSGNGNGSGSHTVEKLAAYPSVALFMDRAASYGKKITVDDQNLGIVSSICEKLDGLPLAIELAAARVKLFSIEELLPKLANPLDVLKGNRKFADRHRTLRNTISWSYDLLSVEEKNLLTWLSIFVGGCSMESILEICEGVEDEFELLDDLTVLIDNSLVVSLHSGSHQRFTLLELIKEFGLEQLEESQRLDSLKRNHLRYFTSLAQKGAQELSGPQDADWSDQFYRELPNFRAAISYALELEEMQMAYDLGKALRVFLGAKGMVMEGINLLETITTKTVPESLYPEKLKVLQVLAFLYFYIPLPEKAIPIFEESYEYWKSENDQENLGLILNDWGWANMMIRECAKCEEMSLEAKAIFEALSNKEKLENSCRNLGFSFMHRYRPLEGMSYFKQSIQLSEQLNNSRTKGYALVSLGYCNLLLGKYDLAIDHIQEAISILQKINDKNLEAFGFCSLGRAYLIKGDYDSFLRNCPEAEELARNVNARYATALIFIDRASIKVYQKDYGEAKIILKEAYKITESLNLGIGYELYYRVYATLAVKINDFPMAKSICRKHLKGQLKEKNFYALINSMEIGAVIAYKEQKLESSAVLYWGSQRWRKELHIPLYAYEEQDYLNLQQQLEESLSPDDLATIKSMDLPLEDLVNLAEEILAS